MAAAKSSTAIFRHVRIAPNKMRAVVNLVRGKPVEQALDLLRYCPRSGATNVLKLIKSAVANADQQGGVDVDRLMVREIRVDEGPRGRRQRARSRGMAVVVIRRTSHVSVQLVERTSK